jgi:ribonucleoside-diphosphate reductase alpha chain
LWTIVLEISVLMAQFPSRQIAELSYEFRTLGLGYANIGGLLMSSGIPYDSAEGRALCRRHHRADDRRRLRHLGRDGGELGAFPAMTPTPSTCCASSATTPRRARRGRRL